MRTAVRKNSIPEPPHHGKISPEFLARLSRLKREAKLHAILILSHPDAVHEEGRTRPTPQQRRAAIQGIRAIATDALEEIDEILSRFGGRRLSETPTALGTISIETTPAGIVALANSSRINAILEDQSISQVP